MIKPRIVALIPARAGSVRVKSKNTRELAGHPLLAYAIGAAQEAGIPADEIFISTDSKQTRLLAERYRTKSHLRPPEYATAESPDIEWVNDMMSWIRADAFCILRPTSPFRRGAWIRKAWEILQACPRADSIRAVRPCKEHPAKMWRQHDPATFDNAQPRFMSPVLTGIGYEAPWHSMPTQLLPTVYTQTAALEIAWTRVLPGSISGQMVLPYYTERWAPEAIDINTEEDWAQAEQTARGCPDWLPPVTVR